MSKDNNNDDLKTPLSDRLAKSDSRFTKDLLGFPAFLGDAAYNVGSAVKKKVDIFGKDHGAKIEAIRNKVLSKRNK